MPSCTGLGLGPAELAPFFCAVTHQMARNHIVRGWREPWKVVWPSRTIKRHSWSPVQCLLRMRSLTALGRGV